MEALLKSAPQTERAPQAYAEPPPRTTLQRQLLLPHPIAPYLAQAHAAALPLLYRAPQRPLRSRKGHFFVTISGRKKIAHVSARRARSGGPRALDTKTPFSLTLGAPLGSHQKPKTPTGTTDT